MSTAQTSVTIRPVEPDDASALDAWWRLHEAWFKEIPGQPPPCRVLLQSGLRHPWPDEQEWAHLAFDGATCVGYLRAFARERDNRDILGIEIVVGREHRGRGHGTTLLELAHRLGSERGCTRLLTELPLDGPGVRWWEAHGGRQVLVETHRRLDLATYDVHEHDRLLADAYGHAGGYSLVRWVTHTPEEHLADRAVLEEKMSTDVPLDDLAWEPEHIDTAWMRSRDDMVAKRGMRQYVTAVHHDASGALVGVTTLTRFATVPSDLDQWETVVLAEHRGHRLGTLLKIENLRFALRSEPQARAVHTANADTNGPMVTVNEALGFRPVRQWAECEMPIIAG